MKPNYIPQDPKTEGNEQVKLVALLRKSFGDMIEKLTQSLQQQLVQSVQKEVQKGLTAGLKELTVTLPPDVLKSLRKEFPTFPKTMKLSDEDVAKLTPKSITIPDTTSLDDESVQRIAKAVETLAGKDNATPLVEKLIGYFKKNPDAWFNVRLTDGKDFYRALAEAFVSAGGGNRSTGFMTADGKPTMALVDDQHRVLTTSSGGTSGGGDASAANQVTMIATLSGIQQITEALRTLKFDVALSVLDARLASIKSNTDDLKTYTDQLETYTDQLEGYVDGLEGLMTNVQNALTSISGRDFATETTLLTRASQTTVSGIQTVLEGIRTLKFDVALSTRASEQTLLTIATQATASGIQQILEDIRTNHLDIALSTRASETTASGIARVTEAIRQRFDVQLSTVATQVTVSAMQQVLESIRTTKFDVALSTRASETTVGNINTAASGIQQILEFLRTNRFTVNQNTLATQTTVSSLQQVVQDFRTLGLTNFGVADFDVAIDFANGQTAATIYTPPTGRKWVITDLDISLAAAGTIRIFDNTDTIANRVTQLIGAANGGKVRAYRKARKSAAADNVLKYTTLSGATGSLEISGYLI